MDPDSRIQPIDHRLSEKWVCGKASSETQDVQAGTGKMVSGDSSISVNPNIAAGREYLSKQLARVCSMDLPPDNPCVAFPRD